MHKKLESELMSIAHSILQMKNKNDVMALKIKAQELYERLSVLAFVDEYIETTPNAEETHETLVSKIELAVKGVFDTPKQADKEVKEEASKIVAEEKIEEVKANIDTEGSEEILVDKIELALQGVFTDFRPIDKVLIDDEIDSVDETENTDELFLVDKLAQAMQGVFNDSEQVDEVVIEKVLEVIDKVIPEKSVTESATNPIKQLSLEEEFKDTISVDVTQDLFQKVEEKPTPVKATLNDTLMQKNIQVGLNDRIAFVKYLFNHSQADFNRVLSQLNSIETEKEAKNFIQKMVKPDYDWSGKEEYEERLMGLIERKF